MASRPDASMSLLTDLQEGALEPEYQTTTHPRRGGPTLLITVLLLAVLMTLAILQTTRGADANAEQRQDLLDRIGQARERQEELTQLVAALDEEVRELGRQGLVDPAQREELERVSLHTGSAPVTGPGIVLTVDDAPNAQGTAGMVLDGDLTRMVNGLYLAGAEAISINGRRLTTLTPIRSAGAAITVDYVSLTPPYRVEVIGDPGNLQARFNETPGAAWWHFLTQNYGVTMSITQSEVDLDLAADAGMTLRYAEKG